MGKYEEALERAKQGLPIDEVFPELKESEDERIRKDLIVFIRQFAPEHLKVQYVAYLEKQKDSKVVKFDHDREQQPAEWGEGEIQRVQADGRRFPGRCFYRQSPRLCRSNRKNRIAMTKEEKQLLLIDLCARLPYGVIVDNPNPAGGTWDTVINIDVSAKTVTLLYNGWVLSIDEIKPYLRPMSSMTEEEKGQYKLYISMIKIKVRKDGSITLSSAVLIDWLYAHYLDFHGLIPKGLALEAPSDMYKTE